MESRQFVRAGLAAVIAVTTSIATPVALASRSVRLQPDVSRSSSTQAPAAQAVARTEKTAWYFYRVKWGFQDEFVDLFQRNHYPVLKAQMKTGRIVALRTYVPTYHGDGRADWTFAVSITFRDIAAMTGPSGEAEIVKRLFPDQAAFRREEQRRFELLDAHWDVPLNELDLDTRQPSGR